MPSSVSSSKGRQSDDLSTGLTISGQPAVSLSLYDRRWCFFHLRRRILDAAGFSSSTTIRHARRRPEPVTTNFGLVLATPN